MNDGLDGSNEIWNLAMNLLKIKVKKLLRISLIEIYYHNWNSCQELKQMFSGGTPLTFLIILWRGYLTAIRRLLPKKSGKLRISYLLFIFSRR
jgi:hypothetical protein